MYLILGCLVYLYEVSGEVKWDYKLTRAAAECGNLECLTFAHKNKCEIEQWATYKAAKNNKLDCLIYLYENGCKLDEKTAIGLVSRRKNKNIVRYLFKIWSDPQEFVLELKEDFNYVDLDLDDVVWRKMINLNIDHLPSFKKYVESFKKTLQIKKQALIEAFEEILPLDMLFFRLFRLTLTLRLI